MEQFDTETLQRLVRELTEPLRLHEGAALAGTGLQMPMVTLRARSARHELTRIELRDGAKGPEARRQAALVAALDRRAAETADTLARRSIEPPALTKGEAALVGRITRDCEALAGVTVMVLDAQDEPLRQTCTGRDGRYAVALPGGTEIRLEVREDGKPVWRDGEAFAYPANFRGQRDIEIAEGDPVCSPAAGRDGSAVQMPSLVGLEVRIALQSLEALGLKPSKIDETPSAEPGIVLAQTPKAGSAVERGAEVALQVGAKDDRPAAAVGDLAGTRLDLGLRRMAETRVAPASVSFVRGSDETAVIRDSRANTAGDSLHLTVAVPDGDAARIGVAAEVLAMGEEGRAIGLDSPDAAAKWLETAQIATLTDAATAAGEDDATLRKRLALEPRASVALQRRALLTLATRIRDA
jgi:hypothetical protein